MRTVSLAVIVAVTTLSANSARADRDDRSSYDDDERGRGSFALTMGESVYFVGGSAYRGPFSLEAVPSFGWRWFKLDLGLSTTLESVRIAGTDVGDWNFTFRPGGRITPPMLHGLYGRFAIPLEFQEHNVDWGVLFGVGVDIHLVSILGLVLETDTTLSNRLRWSGDGLPLEFRAGISLHPW
jgi:hypothetical protein